MTYYEVWDLVSGNLVLPFNSLEEALQFVSESVEDGNEDEVGDWGLIGTKERGERGLLAEGLAILDLKETESPVRDDNAAPAQSKATPQELRLPLGSIEALAHAHLALQHVDEKYREQFWRRLVDIQIELLQKAIRCLPEQSTGERIEIRVEPGMSLAVTVEPPQHTPVNGTAKAAHDTDKASKKAKKRAAAAGAK